MSDQHSNRAATRERRTSSPDDWEEVFSRWAVGPSPSEQERCNRAEHMIRDAIEASPRLSGRSVRVFAQGSYRNRTNVRKDSDVDVCVLCSDTCYYDLSHVEGVTMESLGVGPATYSFPELKRDVELALVAHFGEAAVKRGSKAFDVDANSYRVAADVVPAFEHRLYYRDAGQRLQAILGITIRDDNADKQIHNFPEQHYKNGVARHEATDRQFKKKVRILKSLGNLMADTGCARSGDVASFLLESLVYNCPNEVFEHRTHYDDMRAVIVHLWPLTESAEGQRELFEVNGIKYLFNYAQPWSVETARTFLREAWNFVGFGG